MSSVERRLLAAAVLALSGCNGNDFEKVSQVRGVRVLAVRPAAPANADGAVPASGVPGQTMTLDMLYVDGRAEPPNEPDDAPAPLELMWLGGCHNPPSRLYYGCGPMLKAIADGIESKGEIPPGFLGTASPFALPIPENILSSAPVVETDPIHFGVSYVFFGVCAGRITPRPDRAEGIPLDCLDASGKPLGQRDFVVGYSTIFTYEGVTNLNPTLPSVLFDGNPVIGPDCEEPGICEPVVAACVNGQECPEHRIAPTVGDESFEHLPDGTNEILWTSYFATSGGVVKESQLVSDRVSGRVDDFTGSWHAPATPGRVRFWVTLNDERGGATWASFDVVVQ